MPALDGLRGLAVIAVVVFHVGHLKGGYLGVDLFFVLSGFLITSLLLTEGAATGRIGLIRFWERRARRLLPALAVMLVGVAAYAKFAAFPSELHRIRWDGIATMLYVANWREVFTKVDYWSLFISPSPLNHTWSLAIEEQFYLIWPLVFLGLVALARRREPMRHQLATYTLIVAIILGIASLTATLVIGSGASWSQVVGGDPGWNRVYFGTDTRAFAILAGAAVAATSVRFGSVPEGRQRRLLETAGVLSAIGLGFAWSRLGEGSSFLHHGGLAACSLAAAVVLTAASHPRPGFLARVLSWRPLRAMGLISYGVYLYHWPIIVWLNRERTGLGGWSLVFLQVGTTLFLSTISYLVVEQPIRRGSRWSRPVVTVIPVIAFSSVGVLLVLTTTGYLPLNEPRVPNGVTKAAPSPNGPRIMVIGDSVASFIADEGMVYLRANPQPKVLNLAVDGCSEPPAKKIRNRDGTVSSFFAGHCDDGWDKKARQFRPTYVVYTTIGVGDSEYFHDGDWLSPCSPAFRSWVIDRVGELAEMFGRHGGTLVVATTVPGLPPPALATIYDKGLDATSCWNTALRKAVSQHRQKIMLIDLAQHFCKSDRSCNLRTPYGIVAREDGSHFRGRSAQIIAKIIFEQLGIDSKLP